MLNIRAPQATKQAPKAAALDDLRRLIQVASVRDRAILFMLADTGIRAGGLVGLRLDDLNLDRRIAIVTEKGGKSRSVAFLPITGETISTWLAIRPAGGNTVFCGRYGAALAVNSLNQAFGRLKKRAGVDGRVNPHSFRHFFAREYIQNGGDLASLTHLMGHSSSLVTTNYYAVFQTEELQAKHDRHSPIRNLGGISDNLQ
jgi:site-specific recombinase XerC